MSVTFPEYVCPTCHSTLSAITVNRLKCHKEGTVYSRQNNIWCFLTAELQKKYARFMQEYETVREAEGRGINQANYYESLPFKDISGNFSSDWRIRAGTYRKFLDKVVKPVSATIGSPLRILDLGAGNGWLSNRLAELQHKVVALDLTTNRFDGLGACSFYKQKFELVQAGFDFLPFPDSYFDLVVFNASLHYSEDYLLTLGSALRVLTQKGRIVIMDTPVYHSSDSGDQMVKEREVYFAEKFGFISDALQSLNYLTHSQIEELSRTCNITWQIIEPYYGFKWYLKPIRARLKRLREPARFIILVGIKK
jgi:ubiquinone/menaquinone biosynthesis C-methylase UbiE